MHTYSDGLETEGCSLTLFFQSSIVMNDLPVALIRGLQSSWPQRVAVK